MFFFARDSYSDYTFDGIFVDVEGWLILVDFFLGGRLNVQQWCNLDTKDAFLTSVAMINQHIGITLHWSCGCGLGKTPLSHVIRPTLEPPTEFS